VNEISNNTIMESRDAVFFENCTTPNRPR